MSEVDAKFETLIHNLLAATEAGKIAWEDTADEAEFRAVLGPGMVRIGRHRFDADDGEGLTVFTLTLLNRHGRIAEEFAAREGGIVEAAASLFELARRSALKGETLIDDLLADLEGRLVGA